MAIIDPADKATVYNPVFVSADWTSGDNTFGMIEDSSYTNKSAAPVVEKLLRSAIANAENNLSMDRESLYVAEVYANQGPTMKRYWARSHGRADQILKRSSHITVVLDQAK